MTPGGGGKALPPASAFADDDGAAPPALTAASAQPDPQTRLEAVVAALRTTRVLVPVVARLEELAEPGEHGIAGEKTAHAAMVTVAVPDGRAALPVFSSGATMQSWRADARPVPVEGRRAALAAGSDADGLLVLDPGSARAVQVPRPAVRAIAMGEDWVPAYLNAVVSTAVHEALTRVPGVRSAQVEQGVGTEVRVVVELALDPAAARAGGPNAAIRACREALAASETIVDLVDSVSIRTVLTQT